MSLISSIPTKPQLISKKTVENNIDLGKKIFFENELKYIDNYHKYNYLFLTDTRYGLRFQNREMVPLSIEVNTKLELLLYFSRYRDATEIDPEKLELVRQSIRDGTY